MRITYSLRKACALLLLCCGYAQAENDPIHAEFCRQYSKPGTFSFALIGDLPYSDEQALKYDNLLSDLNKHRT